MRARVSEFDVPTAGLSCRDIPMRAVCGDISTRTTCRDIPTVLRCRDMSTDHSGQAGAYRIYSPASLGEAIRHYRNEAGLTQAELADATGLQRSYLSELENGKETEQLTRLLRVLRRLGVRITLDKADW
jgi:HTH-type transcriptional regulator / antitoxin HipB